MEFPEIHFGGNNPKLHSYRKFNWLPGESRLVEFYPNQLISVTLLYSSDPSLFEKLTTLIDGQPISIDLEWSQPWNHSPHIIELFQFSSSKGTIVVASDQNKGYEQIKEFLQSTKFFGKGMSYDKKKLKMCCNGNFDEIEDIEQTRLLPNNLTINFDSLTMMFLGPGTAKFKDHKVQTSNWSVRPLSILQILYASHDSYSMLETYKKIIEKYGNEIKPIPIKPKSVEKNAKSKSNFIKYKCHYIDIDEICNQKGIVINYDNLNDDDMFGDKNVSIKELLFQYEKKKNVDVENENSCFIQFADQVLNLLLPTQSKATRYQCLEKICLASDLLFLGITHYLHDETFICQVCDKHLHDPLAFIQHCENKHCSDLSINHNLKSKDVFLHYLTATDCVKCPFTVVFDNSQLKNMELQKIEEEEEEEDSFDDNNSIVPKTYNESDGIKCCICNENFDSVENLKNHCWLVHYELFVKLITGKGIDKKKDNDDKKLNLFGLFCIKKLKLADVNPVDFSVKCKICNFSLANPIKFFLHIFFKHQDFAIVHKNQYNKWPIKYEEFTYSMIKKIKNIDEIINIDDLEKYSFFDKKENKCVDCGASFENDDEIIDHYIKKHLIYFPLVDE